MWLLLMTQISQRILSAGFVVESLPPKEQLQLQRHCAVSCQNILNEIADKRPLLTLDIFITARSTPFVVGFVTDANEVVLDTGGDATTDEEILAPGGIIGFRLDYEIRAC